MIQKKSPQENTWRQQFRAGEGWRNVALVEGRANSLEKAVELEVVLGLMVSKKKIIPAQLANETFQNVSGFKIWENILTGFHSFASAKPK